MKFWLMLCALLAASTAIHAQSAIKSYVSTHTHEISSNKITATDDSDLAIIARSIGDKRIVMLGEEDHGDAATFEAKGRLIKFLHEKKGFDVLVMESSFSMNGDFRNLDPQQDYEHRKRAIFAHWTNCDACVPLFDDYIPGTLTTTTPMHLAGLDSRVMPKACLRLIDSVMEANQIPLVSSTVYQQEIRPALSQYFNASDSTGRGKIIAYIRQIRKVVQEKLGENDYYTYCLGNLETMAGEIGGRDYVTHFLQRDSMMALNLQWLANSKYKDRKIIVWAANIHVQKNSGNYTKSGINTVRTMGTYFCDNHELAAQTYILGFTALQGRAGRLYPTDDFKIPKAKKNSFETWINKDYEFAFLDFAEYNNIHNQPERFYMTAALAKYMSAEAPWTLSYDGMFYVKNMYRCNEVKHSK